MTPSLRFWDDYQIKFKAGEVPSALIIPNPSIEELTLTYGRSSRRGRVTKKIGNAYFLNKNEILETPFWVDKNDAISFISDETENFYRNRTDTLLISTGNDWHKSAQGHFVAKKEGYIKIKALWNCAFNKVNIIHNKIWKWNLKPNTTKKIKVYKGDYLYSSSNSRYYVDGKLVERNLTHAHAIYENIYMDFKSSIDPKTIKVWVAQRRHY